MMIRRNGLGCLHCCFSFVDENWEYLHPVVPYRAVVEGDLVVENRVDFRHPFVVDSSQDTWASFVAWGNFSYLVVAVLDTYREASLTFLGVASWDVGLAVLLAWDNNPVP